MEALANALSRMGIPCSLSKLGLRATVGSDPGKKWTRHIELPLLVMSGCLSWEMDCNCTPGRPGV